MSKEYIYKILHKPTGLFYCSRKGRWNDKKTNLSKKGNFYTSLAMVEKVGKDIRVDINKAQVERYGLDVHDGDRWSYSRARSEDLEIVKYSLERCEL